MGASIYKNKKPLLVFLFPAFLFMTVYLYYPFFKNIVKRIRPFKYTSTLISHAWDAPNGYSFPSGHSSSLKDNFRHLLPASSCKCLANLHIMQIILKVFTG